MMVEAPWWEGGMGGGAWEVPQNARLQVWANKSAQSRVGRRVEEKLNPKPVSPWDSHLAPPMASRYPLKHPSRVIPEATPGWLKAHTTSRPGGKALKSTEAPPTLPPHPTTTPRSLLAPSSLHAGLPPSADTCI